MKLGDHGLETNVETQLVGQPTLTWRAALASLSCTQLDAYLSDSSYLASAENIAAVLAINVGAVLLAI